MLGETCLLRSHSPGPGHNHEEQGAGTSNTNLGAAKYEFWGVYFAFFTVNTAKNSPNYFRICEYGPYVAFLLRSHPCTWLQDERATAVVGATFARYDRRRFRLKPRSKITPPLANNRAVLGVYDYVLCRRMRDTEQRTALLVLVCWCCPPGAGCTTHRKGVLRFTACLTDGCEVADERSPLAQ